VAFRHGRGTLVPGSPISQADDDRTARAELVLEEVHILRLRHGLDSRIDRLQRRCVAKPGVLSLAGGLPANETFPTSALARALSRAGTDALQYDWPEGRQALRTWVAARLKRRGATVEPDEVLITSGAQQALDIAVQIGCKRGDAMRVPAACYPGALELFSARGLRLVSEDAAAEVTYVMPLVENPTGLAVPLPARASLLRSEGYIVEDDAYADLRFDGRSSPPLLASVPDRVFYVGTFSKTLCPGLRVGWLVTPRNLKRGARRAKRIIDLQANSLAQRVLEGYLAQENFDERLDWLRLFYAERAEALVAALRSELPSLSFLEPEGGFSVWAVSEEPGDDVEFLAMAHRYGVSVDPGRDFRPSGDSEPIAFRLAFSSLPPERMREAVRRLARAFHAFTRMPRAQEARAQ
jgi:2-aminoadipate transaminase